MDIKDRVKETPKPKKTKKIKKELRPVPNDKNAVAQKILKKRHGVLRGKKDSPPLSDHAYYEDSVFEPNKQDSSFISYMGEVHHSKISGKFEVSD